MEASIIITGATGVIGRRLVKTAKNLKVCSVGYNQPDMFRGDLTDPMFMKCLPKVDYIIHCAGYAQPAKFMANPIKTIKLNTSVLIQLFKKLNQHGTLLFLSSSEVYSGVRPPYKETDIGNTDPSHPRACYIESKRCGEAICNTLGGKVARLSLVYGAGSKDGRALNRFIQQGLNGTIYLLDQGEAKRTYCYVDDAVEMLWRILFDGVGTYNVGGKSRTTIRELAGKIGSILNVPVIPGVEGLSDAPQEVEMDLTRIENEFKKKEFIDLDEGLRRTIKWFKGG